MRVEKIKVGEKLLGVFCPVDKKVSSTHLSQILEGLGEIFKALELKSSMKRLLTKGSWKNP